MKLVFSHNAMLKEAVNKEVLGIFSQKATSSMMKSIFFRIAGVIIFVLLMVIIALPFLYLKLLSFEALSGDIISLSPFYSVYAISWFEELLFTFYWDQVVLFILYRTSAAMNNAYMYLHFMDLFGRAECKVGALPLLIMSYLHFLVAVFAYFVILFIIAIAYHIFMCIPAIFKYFENASLTHSSVTLNKKTFFNFIFKSFFILIAIGLISECLLQFQDNYTFESIEEYLRFHFSSYRENILAITMLPATPQFAMRHVTLHQTCFDVIAYYEQFYESNLYGEIYNIKEAPERGSKEFRDLRHLIWILIHHKPYMLQFMAEERFNCFYNQTFFSDFWRAQKSLEVFSFASQINLPLDLVKFGESSLLTTKQVLNAFFDYVSNCYVSKTTQSFIPTFTEIFDSFYQTSFYGGPVDTIQMAAPSSFHRDSNFSYNYEWLKGKHRIESHGNPVPGVRVGLKGSLEYPIKLILEVGNPTNVESTPFIAFCKRIGIKLGPFLCVDPSLPLNQRDYIDGHQIIREAIPIHYIGSFLDFRKTIPTNFSYTYSSIFPVIEGEIYSNQGKILKTTGCALVDSLQHLCLKFDSNFINYYTFNNTCIKYYPQRLELHSSNILSTLSPSNFDLDGNLIVKKNEDLKVKQHVFFGSWANKMYKTLTYMPRDLIDSKFGAGFFTYFREEDYNLMWSYFDTVFFKTPSGKSREVLPASFNFLIYRDALHNTSFSAEQYKSEIFVFCFEMPESYFKNLLYTTYMVMPFILEFDSLSFNYLMQLRIMTKFSDEPLFFYILYLLGHPFFALWFPRLVYNEMMLLHEFDYSVYFPFCDIKSLSSIDFYTKSERQSLF
jgi:hypothetical protein